MKRLVIYLFLLILANSCELFSDRVYSFWIYNNSDVDLNYILGFNYPDTLVPNDYELIGSLKSFEKVPVDSKESWENVFNEMPLDTLSVFIFSRDSLVELGWNKLISEYIILKRLELSIEDIRLNDWTITYP